MNEAVDHARKVGLLIGNEEVKRKKVRKEVAGKGRMGLTNTHLTNSARLFVCYRRRLYLPSSRLLSSSA
jgi:hypothetical protein